MNLSELSVGEARRALDSGEYTAVDLAKKYLTAIEEKNSDLNAYVEVFSDVLDQAKVADEKIKKGEVSALTGIPIAVKDNILIKDRNASAGSKMLEHYVSPYDATVIEKLKNESVVFLGRTNMDEFALGGSTENSAWGPTKNPHDTERVPGGTSGGSAAVVAAGLALVALGSDTGGSIRQPASFCGVVGFKPTYGAVSRYGLIAAASSLDQIGTIGKTSEDAKILFDSIKGHDEKDSTSRPDDFYKKAEREKSIGVPRKFLAKGIDSKVMERFEEKLKELEVKGYEIRDIEIPSLEYALAAYYIINPAEVSSNLARFDGIRYGLSLEGESNDEVYEKTRGEGFGKEVRRRILVGTFVLSAGYFDAYYRKAAAVRNLLRSDLEKIFKDVGFIAMPTAPTPAFKLGEKEDPLSMYAADICTVPVNLAGVPAVSIPMGSVTENGSQLPVGFQCIGPLGSDDALFTIASDVERN